MDKAWYLNLTHRTELVLGTEAVCRLESLRVAVIGVGGVGSWCAEALVRSGITKVMIVDSDIVCATNVNRQVQALHSTLGIAKVDVMRQRLLDINPGAEITAYNKPFLPENCEEFCLKDYDYVIDAIDSIQSKIYLLQYCTENGIKVYASMGAAARTDPTRIRPELIGKTHGCPLARIVRQKLKKSGVTLDIPCVYSDEQAVKPAVEAWCGTGKCSCKADRDEAESDGVCSIDWCARKKQINGSLVHITGIFGLTLAGMVIRDATGKGWR
jgi:tRNA A37 threonylcarbamoyladenosine dehydratase